MHVVALTSLPPSSVHVYKVSFHTDTLPNYCSCLWWAETNSFSPCIKINGAMLDSLTCPTLFLKVIYLSHALCHKRCTNVIFPLSSMKILESSWICVSFIKHKIRKTVYPILPIDTYARLSAECQRELRNSWGRLVASLTWQFYYCLVSYRTACVALLR